MEKEITIPEGFEATIDGNKIILKKIESEDERIRKALINALNKNLGNGIEKYGTTLNAAIAWLEKQKEPELSKDLSDYIAELSKQFPEVSFAKLSRIAVRVKNWLEKQGEKPVEEYNITGISSGHATGKLKEIIKDIESEKVESKFKVGDEIKTANKETLTITKIDEKGYWSEDLFICGFDDAAKWELVGRLADKVEPKFHKDEWISNGDYIWKILDVKPLDYILQSQDGNIVDDTISHVDEQFHSFAIEDAKDGDVLCTYECEEPKIVFILKGTPKKYYTLYYYCYYNIMYPHFDDSNKPGCLAPEDSDVKPATKEQRDTLFAKMKEAGYEYDDEKKELKKIEQKPQRMISAEAKEALYDKPAEWSEEDEVKINRIVACLENLNVADNDILLKDVAWLKSLRPQKQWKPSEEQMNILNLVVSDYYHACTKESDKKAIVLKSILEQLKQL